MQFFRAHTMQFVALYEEERLNMSVKLKALALLLLDQDESENERAEREYWVRLWFANRPQFGVNH